MGLKFIDFFSGIGGFRLGMEMAGHECAGHCEIDKYANKSYAAMHMPKEDEWFGEDITKVRANDLPRADIWCFGFPCQDISVAGKQLGFNGKRSSLFFTVTRIISDLKEEDRPSILFIENVKNLLSVNGGTDFLKLLIEMDEIGYDVEWQVLNSKDFRVPQNRERVFIIGHLRGRCTRKVFPIERVNNEIALKQLIPGSDAQRVYDSNGLGRTIKAEGGGQGAKTGLYFIDLNKNPKITENARCLKVKYNAGVTNRGYDNSGVLEVKAVLTPDRLEKHQNGRRFKEDGEPMFTLTAQDRHGVAILRSVRTEYGKEIRKAYEAGKIQESRHNMTQLEPRTDGISNTLTTVQKDNLLLENTRIRRLTPRECFRLQGWPDEYFDKAAAVNSDTQLYRQAGNGVTVQVIYEIAKRL